MQAAVCYYMSVILGAVTALLTLFYLETFTCKHSWKLGGISCRNLYCSLCMWGHGSGWDHGSGLLHGSSKDVIFQVQLCCVNVLQILFVIR